MTAASNNIDNNSNSKSNDNGNSMSICNNMDNMSNNMGNMGNNMSNNNMDNMGNNKSNNNGNNMSNNNSISNNMSNIRFERLDSSSREVSNQLCLLCPGPNQSSNETQHDSLLTLSMKSNATSNNIVTSATRSQQSNVSNTKRNNSASKKSKKVLHNTPSVSTKHLRWTHYGSKKILFTPNIIVQVLMMLLILSSPIHSSCIEDSRNILQVNRPEVVLATHKVVDVLEIRHNIEITVSWSHILQLLKQSKALECIKSFLVHWEPHNHINNDILSDKRNHNRNKRESVAKSAHISRPLDPKDLSGLNVSLPDDCRVFAFSIVAVINDDAMLDSGQKLIWPAGRHVLVESFANALILTWPPACIHATRSMRISICHNVNKENNQSNDKKVCQGTELDGVRGVHHVTRLSACTKYEALLQDSKRNETIWTISHIATLPLPQVNLFSNYDTMRLIIKQLGCSEVVMKWRVSWCRQMESSFEDDEDEGESGWSEFESQKPASSSCSHALASTQTSAPFDTTLELTELRPCSLYAVDVLPVDDNGRPLQPGEQYGTIHSTLCGPQQRPRSTSEQKAEESDGSVYFGDEEETTSSNISIALILTLSFIVAVLIIAFIATLMLTRNRLVRLNTTNGTAESSPNSPVDNTQKAVLLADMK